MVAEFVEPNVELGTDGGFALAVEHATLTSQFTSLEVLSTTAYTISYKYASPSGNNPQANGNGLLIWQGEEPVFGSGQTPNTTPVPSTDPSGEPTWALTDGLRALNYVVAYSTDGSARTIVATAGINSDGTPGDSYSSTITMGSVNTGSAVVSYDFPPGYRPNSFGNRLGLHEGQYGAHDFPDGGRMTRFPRDDNSGPVAINYPFVRSTWYTIVYFAGSRAEDAAGFVRFQTAG